MADSRLGSVAKSTAVRAGRRKGEGGRRGSRGGERLWGEEGVMRAVGGLGSGATDGRARGGEARTWSREGRGECLWREGQGEGGGVTAVGEMGDGATDGRARGTGARTWSREGGGEKGVGRGVAGAAAGGRPGRLSPESTEGSGTGGEGSGMSGPTGTGDVLRDMTGRGQGRMQKRGLVSSNSKKKVGPREDILAAIMGVLHVCRAERREGARAGVPKGRGPISGGDGAHLIIGSGGARAGDVRNRGREFRERILRIVVVVASVVDGRGREA